MKYLQILIVVTSFILFNACDIKKEPNADYVSQMRESISFFDKAYDRVKGVYISDVDWQGDILSSDIHTVALSRMLYGLSYAAALEPDYHQRANELLSYQQQNMIGQDGLGSYFIPTVGDSVQEDVEYLDIWQQAYGLCGMTELYRFSKDPALLAIIRKHNDLLITRFRDEISGGFFADYKVGEGGISGTKTLQSIMYPITAYMANLWLADKENRKVYEQIIQEHLSIAYREAWNDSLGWVNIRFTDNWEAITEKNAVVSPGHNFQLAALLLRSAKWPFIAEEERANYKALAMQIIMTTLRKPVWSEVGIADGFYENINPNDDTILSDNKSWWQHCEALIALSLAGDEFNEEFDLLYHFYFNTFIDKENGGEWAKVDRNNQPVIEPKGQRGKSVYHHIELIRFLLEAEKE